MEEDNAGGKFCRRRRMAGGGSSGRRGGGFIAFFVDDSSVGDIGVIGAMIPRDISRVTCSQTSGDVFTSVHSTQLSLLGEILDYSSISMNMSIILFLKEGFLTPKYLKLRFTAQSE